MPTVAIPAETVGDTDTLRQRAGNIKTGTFHWANALGKAAREGRSTDYCVAQVVEMAEPWDAVMDELHRRHLAWRLAHPAVGREW